MFSTFAKPSPKSVVEMFIAKSGEQKRGVHGRTGATIRQDVVFILYDCPLKAPCSANGAFAFEKLYMFSNQYRHLKYCLTGGDEHALLSIYKAAMKEKLVMRKFTSSSYLKCNKREMTIFRFRKLVALKNYPISCVSDDDLRDLSECIVRICIQSFKETMFKLVGIFEAKIQAKVQQSKGAIMYEGWTSNTMHCMGLFAVYMGELSVYRSGMLFKEKELASPLLSASPTAKPSGDTDVTCKHSLCEIEI